MKGVGILVAVAMTALALPLGGASHGDDPFEGRGYCPEYSLYVPETAEEESFPVYFMFDAWSGEWLYVVWLYAESNGVEGLQRYDGYCTNAPNLGPGTQNHAYHDIHDLILY